MVKNKENMVQLFEAIRANKYRMSDAIREKFKNQISDKFLDTLAKLAYSTMILYVDDFLRQVWLEGVKNG